MAAKNEPLWTIAELGSQAALALSENYDGQQNGSVREIPDLRTIRFYTTRGLIDPPAQLRGRTALYGLRHLLQLVAIKRLQARGLTLVEIQQKLLGLTDVALQRLAQVSPGTLADADTPANAAEESPRREQFWRQPPADFSPAQTNNETEAAPPLVQGVRLGEGVTLLLEASRPLDADDVEAIRAAAGPLLKLLEKRRLT
jgi:DNA-binding transcriptional MerR regulator